MAAGAFIIKRYKIVVSSVPLIHCRAIKTTEFRLNDARLNKMLPEGRNNAGMLASLQPFGVNMALAA